jgi:hypothetical protein
MARLVEPQFEFPASYEITQLDSIDRRGRVPVFTFPGPVEVDRQQELADSPIIRVEPADGEPWIGVFYGSRTYGVPPAMRGRLIGWPDEQSLCVLYAGTATVVRANQPHATFEIDDAFPITDLLVVPSDGLVLFADFTDLVAYDAGGLRWKSGRLVWDDLAIVGVADACVVLEGFDAPSNQKARFTVELATGIPHGHPYAVMS